LYYLELFADATGFVLPDGLSETELLKYWRGYGRDKHVLGSARVVTENGRFQVLEAGGKGKHWRDRTLYVHVYDKTAEIGNSRAYGWLRGDWRRRGWEGERVWRTEFVFYRRKLKAFGLHDRLDLLPVAVPDLWAYCAKHWLSLRAVDIPGRLEEALRALPALAGIPRRPKDPRGRKPRLKPSTTTHPYWRAIRAAYGPPVHTALKAGAFHPAVARAVKVLRERQVHGKPVDAEDLIILDQPLVRELVWPAIAAEDPDLARAVHTAGERESRRNRPSVP
jgi:hypothetical protein